MMQVGITGCNGQLGQSFQSISDEFENVRFEFFSREEWDITNEEDVPAILGGLDVLINCAAYTKVDQAESEPDIAYSINQTAVAILAKHCAAYDVYLIHFSSDYVYHNGLNQPLRETDPTRPKGVYARSKLGGEEMIRRYCPDHLIFRVSWLYGPFGHNFPKTMLRLASQRSAFRIVNDQHGAPTNTIDLARMILSLVGSIESFEATWSKCGTYNYCNLGRTSWDRIARLLFDEIGREDITIEAIPSFEYPTPAKRPLNSMLDLSKFRQTWDWTIPDWEDSMRRTLRQLMDGILPNEQK